MSRQLTADERTVFSAIQEAPNIGLVQAAFDGEETAVIATTRPARHKGW